MFCNEIAKIWKCTVEDEKSFARGTIFIFVCILHAVFEVLFFNKNLLISEIVPLQSLVFFCDVSYAEPFDLKIKIYFKNI